MSTEQITVKQISGLSFNSIVDNIHPVFGSFPKFYSTFNFEFESDFLPKDDNYGNIFQTGSDPKTLRVELIHPASLQFVIGYKDDPGQKVYPISDEVRMNTWNHIQLTYSSNQKLYVKLNDEPAVFLNDNKYDVAINDLVLGAGYNRQRTFQGLIKNANFKITFSETNDLLFILSLISKYYFILVFSQLLFFYAKYLRKQSVRIKGREHNDVFSGFIITFSVIAFVVLLTEIVASPLAGLRKWIPYILLLIPSVALGMNYLKIKWFEKKYFLVIAGLLSLIVIALGINNYIGLSLLSVSSVIIALCFLSVIPLMKRFSYIPMGISVFLLSINSVIFMNNYGAQNYIWTLTIMLITMGTFLFSLYGKSSSRWFPKINKIGFIVLLIISSLLALRSDSLFLGPAEFHWNYFTGVIQTIRSGGELLWSAPSQYGFLSVLLPSVLPWTSRNSFFIFQAVLFFICSLIIIKTIYMCFRNKAVFIPIALIALSLFYLADPSLIGPTSFPSSSIMRFFPVYVLVYAILLGYYKRSILNDGIKWIAACAYILGALWSAESMLYCTAIYGTYLLSSAIAMYKLKKNSGLKFLLTNTLVIFLPLICMNILYLIATGHFPDWSMYFMYVSNYAKGYGELAITPWGIYWAVIIVLSAIVFILWRLYSAKKYTEWIVVSVCLATLWIVTSYFIGRAVTNNLTALLPLIFYVFIVMLSVLTNSKFITYRILLTAVFLPWIVVGIVGGIGNPQFIDKLQQFKFAENINSKSFKPDKELSSILQSLEATKGTRIAYYGPPYGNPVIPDSKGGYVDPVAGMPLPMTLLEEPISEQKRDIIVGRFLNGIKGPIYLIHKKNENMERFLSWENFFKQEYIMEKKEIGNGKYEVFLVKRK